MGPFILGIWWQPPRKRTHLGLRGPGMSMVAGAWHPPEGSRPTPLGCENLKHSLNKMHLAAIASYAFTQSKSQSCWKCAAYARTHMYDTHKCFCFVQLACMYIQHLSQCQSDMLKTTSNNSMNCWIAFKLAKWCNRYVPDIWVLGRCYMSGAEPSLEGSPQRYGRRNILWTRSISISSAERGLNFRAQHPYILVQLGNACMHLSTMSTVDMCINMRFS